MVVGWPICSKDCDLDATTLHPRSHLQIRRGMKMAGRMDGEKGRAQANAEWMAIVYVSTDPYLPKYLSTVYGLL